MIKSWPKLTILLGFKRSKDQCWPVINFFSFFIYTQGIKCFLKFKDRPGINLLEQPANKGITF
jgi:hypothetical protein